MHDFMTLGAQQQLGTCEVASASSTNVSQEKIQKTQMRQKSVQMDAFSEKEIEDE